MFDAMTAVLHAMKKLLNDVDRGKFVASTASDHLYILVRCLHPRFSYPASILPNNNVVLSP
jgi:hypothetical protein